MSSRSHNFLGIGQYAEQIMDLAEGKPAFTARGEKPSNKTVLAEIASINKCKQGHFFLPVDPSSHGHVVGIPKLLLENKPNSHSHLQVCLYHHPVNLRV